LKKVDGVLIHIAAFMIVFHDHPDVLMAGHTLHLAIGKAQIECPGDGRPPQIVRGKRLFGFIEPGKPGPAVDDFADLSCRERFVKFERAKVDGRLKDESVVAVAVEIPPALGTQF
jgi:hypothetical protein